MASHILMATVTGIALSTPAWADDPAEAPIVTCIEGILFDPAEAPIDTEMKIILWIERSTRFCGRTPQVTVTPCDPAWATEPPPGPALPACPASRLIANFHQG
jgi:hypothetical protein